MIQFLVFFIFLIAGIMTAVAHYLKKRYWDHTLCCPLWTYLMTNREATAHAFAGIVTAEFSFAVAHTTGWEFSLYEIGMVLSSGYISDSVFNRSTETKT